MKIRELSIANFKAIDQVVLAELNDVVVIAGPNGSGKSTIFDAIRFWKSSIGAYQKDELQNWLNELGVGSESDSLLYAHQNKDEPFSIRAAITLSHAEVEYIKDNATSLLAYYFFKQQSQQGVMSPTILSMQNLELVQDFRSKKDIIMSQVQGHLHLVDALIAEQQIIGSVVVTTKGEIASDAPFVLQLVLSIFVDQVGVIEHYGPQRSFGRQKVQNLNLEVETQIRSQRQSSALYNHSNKYSNVKSELASAYVKRLIAQSAGANMHAGISLETSIGELFNQFIPGKSFKGIVPTAAGSLTFDVRTASGTHDIDDLSSGEKELIYGYLRLRNSGLQNSVIMIDEPELHLNPRLTDGLPDFYYRHLGKSLGNQLWLVTHSDTILRQSVGYEGFNVFHMRTVGTYKDDEHQLSEISAQPDLNRAVIDLIGDMAAFSPGGKLVMLEGGGRTEYDKHLIQRLFPEFAQRVNLVSSENKTRVRALHHVLERVGSDCGLFSGVYSIVDSDTGYSASEADAAANRFKWDVYHIENYILEPFFIRKVLVDSTVISKDTTVDEVYNWLREAAATTKDGLVRHEVEQYARSRLVEAIKIHTDRSSDFTVASLDDLVSRSTARITDERSGSLSLEGLTAYQGAVVTKLDAALAGDEWLRRFKGRDILHAFVRLRGEGKLNYDFFRNQISARMRDVEYQPIGIGNVLSRIDDLS